MHQFQSALFFGLCAAFVTGCLSPDPEFGQSSFPITASPAEEIAILEVANTAGFAELDDEVGLDRRAARNIVDRRGSISGFSTLEQLDAVPYVGDRALNKLLDYADAPIEMPGETFVHGVAEDSSDALAILRTANTASQSVLDDEVGLDRRAATNIVSDRGAGFESLLELDAVSYVGASAFARLAEYSDSTEVNDCSQSAQQATFTPAGSSIWPHAAWNGSEYGMVWEERDFFRNPVSREVLFTRLDANGNALGQPIEITNNSAADSTTPRIAWGDSSQAYGVVWEDNSSGSSDLMFQRVGAHGETLGSANVIAEDTGRTSEAALTPLHIVYSDNEWAVVWESVTNGSKEVLFLRIDEDGDVVGAPTLVSGDPLSDSASPQIAWNGSDYLVVWSDSRHHGGDREIYAAAVSESGIVQDEQRISDASGNSWSPQVVWNGDDYAVVWADNRMVAGALGVIDFVRVDTDGIPIAGSENTLGDGTTQSFLPSLAWSGSTYEIVWNDVNPHSSPITDEIVFAVLDASGNTITDKTVIGIVGSGASGYENVYWNGSDFMMTYYDGSIGNNDIYTSRTDVNGHCL